MQEIINKVAQSNLEIFDLEDYYPKEIFVNLDISQWLIDGFLLKEKEFRNDLKKYDFSIYKNKIIGLQCNTDAILPAWTYLVVATHLIGFAKKTIHGNQKDFILAHYNEIFAKIDFSNYQNKSIILKGCSKIEVPLELYTLALNYLQPIAKSIMFGEACASVPVFKKK
jgi:hypothetical protein